MYYCYRCKMVYDYISLKEWLCFCYHYKRVWLTWKCLIGWGRCQWSCLLLPRHYFRLGNNYFLATNIFFHCIKGWKLTGDLLCYFYIIDNFRSDSSCIASLICVLSTLVPSCENSSFMRNHLFCSRLHEPPFGWDCWTRLMDNGSHFK